MKAANKFIKIALLFLIIYILLIPFIHYLAPRILGMVEATYNVWRGHYEVKIYGDPRFFDEDYAKKIKERYGISHKVVAGCMVNRNLIEYVYGYNYVMKKAIFKTFGEDIIIGIGSACLIN
jgi:hypothetical protein